METSLRVRLEFRDRFILSKKQRSDGLNRSWILLKLQQHRTISDVCTHLLHIFKLRRSCPNGIILSMEGYILPPFESTDILKDKEIICVKKKGGATTDAVEAADVDNLLDNVEVNGLEPGDNGLLYLANNTLDKETEEYQSESEEVNEEWSLGDDDSSGEAVPKKRKALTELQNLKKKKQRLAVEEDAGDEAETDEIDNVSNDPSHPRKTSSKGKSKQKDETTRSATKSNKKVNSSIIERNEQLQGNIEEINQASTVPGAKKMPSRSARRKKAKRQMMRELAKISKKKPQTYIKPKVSKGENKEANGWQKGLLHWKQAPKMPVSNEVVGTDAGPSVTRPGHIRFESHDEDQAANQTGESNETLKWNGSAAKSKGKKWDAQRFAAKKLAKESFKRLITDTQVPILDPDDFDKLPPCCTPKDGDVIAYRLLQLSSAWIPEFSSFRVGRIAYYDARDIVLIPVPEYPIDSDKMNDDKPNDSLYGEDGTLEINYSALVDVRNVKQYEPDAKEAVSTGVNQTPLSDDKDTAENLVSNSNDNKTDVPKDSNSGDGEVNPWDRLIKVKSNIEMSEVNPSNTAGSGLDACPDGAPAPIQALDANKAESSMEKHEPNGSSQSNPWSDANKADPSQENDVKAGSSENDGDKGSSWGRPWSSFVVARDHSTKEQNKGNQWFGGSSRGNVKPWSHGAPRGRGRGRGRG